MEKLRLFHNRVTDINKTSKRKAKCQIKLFIVNVTLFGKVVHEVRVYIRVQLLYKKNTFQPSLYVKQQ